VAEGRDDTALADVDHVRVTVYYSGGETKTASNDQGTYTFTYDDLGRTATQKDMNGITLTYSYNAVDDQTQVAGSVGGTVSSTYDAVHNLKARSLSGGGLVSLHVEYGYDNADRLTQANRYDQATAGTKIGYTDYAYDSGNRLTSEIHRNTGGTALVTYVNAYDAADRITTETRNGTATNYTYDVNSQLTNDGSTAYAYDANGNRTMVGDTTGVSNRLTNEGTWTYSYDLEGNLTEKSKGSGLETWDYTYDLRNQLTEAQKYVGSLQQQVDYKYDVFGDLIDRNVTHSGLVHTKTAYEIVDPSPGITGSVNVVIADLDSGGSLTTRYVPGDGVGEKIARSTVSTAYWVLADRQGSTREVADASGSIVDAITYGGFGGITAETGPSYTGNYTFTGFYQDAVVGIDISATRYYNTGIGQWGQEDRLRFGGGDANLRRYADNSPQARIDPTGTISWTIDRETATITLHATVKLKFRSYEYRGKLQTWTLGDIEKFRASYLTNVPATWNTPSNGKVVLIVAGSETEREKKPRPPRDRGEWGFPHSPSVIPSSKPAPIAFIVPEKWTPKLDIQLKYTGESDITALVYANPPPGDPNKVSFNYPGGEQKLFQGDEVPKETSASGGTQVVAAHEFGHFLGLGHPGKDPAHPESGDYGADIKALMGGGSEMRPGYYEQWGVRLFQEYGLAVSAKIG
jgi:RHS repeat-associated protein